MPTTRCGSAVYNRLLPLQSWTMTFKCHALCLLLIESFYCWLRSLLRDTIKTSWDTDILFWVAFEDTYVGDTEACNFKNVAILSATHSSCSSGSKPVAFIIPTTNHCFFFYLHSWCSMKTKPASKPEISPLLCLHHAARTKDQKLSPMCTTNKNSWSWVASIINLQPNIVAIPCLDYSRS